MAIDCEFFRKGDRNKEHRCLEGDCYYGNTPETRLFGNCCFFCTKKESCEGRCTYVEK